MNVFFHELCARGKSTIIWAVAMVIFAFMCMAKFETITTNGGAAVKEIFKTFPSTVQALFGMNGLDLTTLAGYFGVCFLFVVVILAIHGGLLGTSLVADEERDRTSEFLYTKPRNRISILVAKLFAGLICVAIVWGATTLGFAFTFRQFAPHSGFGHDFALFMAAALLIQLVFFALGVCTVALSRNTVSYGRVVPIAVFASYLLYVFAKMSDKFSWLHYASIFSYFDARDIIATHSLKLHYIVACSIFIITCILITNIAYRRRDL